MENIETIVEQLSSLLGIDFVQDVDNTFHSMQQINNFKLEITLSQDDIRYIDIESGLIGKNNVFCSNTFVRSNFIELLNGVKSILNNAKTLVNSIENFTK